VTLAALHPKAALVRLILVMAGIAIRGRRFEITYYTRIDMTLYAGKTDMLSSYLE
jgi:hypothetical protein